MENSLKANVRFGYSATLRRGVTVVARVVRMSAQSVELKSCCQKASTNRNNNLHVNRRTHDATSGANKRGRSSLIER